MAEISITRFLHPPLPRSIVNQPRLDFSVQLRTRVLDCVQRTTYYVWRGVYVGRLQDSSRGADICGRGAAAVSKRGRDKLNWMARSRRELPFCRPVFLVSGRNRSDTVPYRGDLRRPGLGSARTNRLRSLWAGWQECARVDSSSNRNPLLMEYVEDRRDRRIDHVLSSHPV